MENKENLLGLKNKEFIMECMNIISKNGSNDDVLKLTDYNYCTQFFNMYFAILQQVPPVGLVPADLHSKAGKRRYYPDIISLFDQRYIVCNDWYYKNKINKRDTRSPFVQWVLDL